MKTIRDVLFDNERIDPTRIAVIDDAKTVTYAQLQDRVRGLAVSMRSAGVVKGDRVALVCSNIAEYLIAYYAVTSIGAIYVPLNSKLQAEEHVRLLQNAEPAVLISTGEYPDTIRECTARVPSLQGRVVVIGDEAPEQALRFGAWTAAAGELPTDCLPTPDDAAMIIFTSGTTSEPKGVILSHENVMLDIANVNEIADAKPGDVSLQVTPMYHASGVHALVHIAAGATVCMMAKFLPKNVFERIQELSCTYMFLAPTMLYALMDYPGRDAYDTSSLRVLSYGAAPITGARLEEAMSTFGPILVHAYGLSEATSHASYLTAPEHLEAEGSIGRGVPGLELNVVRPDGQQVGPGEIGEVTLRGKTIMKGYWGKPEETAAALKDGWLHTGDLARLDDRGYVYIVDRIKDLVISGGVNVYPRDVEGTIARHASVAEVAVIGAPDDYWGEALVAVVVPREGAHLEPEEIETYCRAHLGGFQVPKRIIVRNELPKNAAGKVLKRELRSQMLATGERGL